jgi:hypothetical protein
MTAKTAEVLRKNERGKNPDMTQSQYPGQDDQKRSEKEANDMDLLYFFFLCI